MGASVSVSKESQEAAAVKLQAAARGKAARKDVAQNKIVLKANKYAVEAKNNAKSLAKNTYTELVSSGLCDKKLAVEYSKTLVESGKGVVAAAQGEEAATATLKENATTALRVLKSLNPFAQEPVDATARGTTFTLLNLTTLAYAGLLLVLGGLWSVTITSSPWFFDLIGLAIQLAIVAPIYYFAYFIFVLPVRKRAWWQLSTLGLLIVVAVVAFKFLGLLWWPFALANVVLAAAGYLIWKEDAGSLTEPYVKLEEGQAANGESAKDGETPELV